MITKPESLLRALTMAQRPLSVRGVVERCTHQGIGGAEWVEWRDAFRELIDSGEVVPVGRKWKRR